MTCRTYETTNELLAHVLDELSQLAEWAEADAEHAEESEAPATAKDDRRRLKDIRRAYELLDDCRR